MGVMRAGIVIGLIAAALPLLAGAAAAKAPAKKAHAAAAKAAKHEAKADRAAAAANAGLPEAERLAIQADLAWLGDFDGTAGGDFDDKTMASLRAFQQRHSGRAGGPLSAEERTALANAARPHQDAVGWRLIDDPATGAAFGLPAKLIAATSPSRTGSRWASAQGQIVIETFGFHEAALPALFDDEKKAHRRTVEHATLKPDSFVIAGMQGLKKFVMRAQARGGELRGITILYDQATEGIMGPAAVAIADSFQGFPDAGTVSSLGIARSVEYGTALVVTRRGDLLATAQVTQQCQSITVPGFGHAERIAADDSADLALLRLYGATLTPAALTGASNADGDLTLVGIADPRAAGATQADASAVTHALAHLTPQGFAPAPPLGFSGAPAVDAHGRIVGLVDAKLRPVAAAGATGTDPATLVPLDAIRGFLAAQGITPAAESAPIDQSVLRVICVRR